MFRFAGGNARHVSGITPLYRFLMEVLLTLIATAAMVRTYKKYQRNEPYEVPRTSDERLKLPEIGHFPKEGHRKHMVYYGGQLSRINDHLKGCSRKAGSWRRSVFTTLQEEKLKNQPLEAEGPSFRSHYRSHPQQAKGFACTGVFPLNRDIFAEKDFEAARNLLAQQGEIDTVTCSAAAAKHRTLLCLLT